MSTEQRDRRTQQRLNEYIVEREVYLSASHLIATMTELSDDGLDSLLWEDLTNPDPLRDESDLRDEYEDEAAIWDLAQQFKTAAEVPTCDEWLKDHTDDEEKYDRAITLMDEDHDSFTDYLRSEGAQVCDYEDEIFEWWLVSDWLGAKLIEQGETVHESFCGTYTLWGRRTTGQVIYADAVITKIQQATGYGKWILKDQDTPSETDDA